MQKIFDRFAILIICTITILGIASIAFLNELYWVNLIYDDAYYYLGIARNLVENQTSRFAAPFNTNGYQPLWLVLLSISASIFGTGANAMALEIFCCSVFLLLSFFYISKKTFRYGWPAVYTALAFPSVTLQGLETALLPTLIVLYFSKKGDYARGVIGSLLFLTRLDAISILVARDAYKVVSNTDNTYKHWLIILPVSFTYFGINFAIYGSALPVSGLAKSVGNSIGENVLPIVFFAYSSIGIVLAFLGIVLHKKLAFNVAGFLYKEQIISGLVSIGICAIYYGLFSGWSIWGWYYWPIMMSYFFLAQEFCALASPKQCFIDRGISHKKTKPHPSQLWISIFVGCILFVPKTPVFLSTFLGYFTPLLESQGILSMRSSSGRENIKLANKFSALGISQDSFLAMGDRAGSFGYFLGSDYKFFHTEGLVANKLYLDALRSGLGAEYFESLGITHLIVDRESYFEDENTIGVAEPIQGLSAHIGPYLICFTKGSQIDEVVSPNNNSRRLVFLMSSKISCPNRMNDEFIELRKRYCGLRAHSHPTEHSQGIYSLFMRF